MDKKGAVEGKLLEYIMVAVVCVIIVIAVLEFFTPYKITNIITNFMKYTLGMNFSNYG